MELKKSNKANIEKTRGLYTELGLLIALGFALLAFEWKISPKEEVKDEGPVMELIDEELIQVTRVDEPPPPPPEPPKVTDLLEIVADDVQVDTHIDINIEADQATEIVAYEYVETVVEVVEEEEIFFIVEDMPTFNGKPADEGFRDYVAANTVYPPVAAENGISGRVLVEFTIDQQGNLVDAKVVRSQDPLLDTEALRVIRSSPKWTPGRQRGKTVKVKYTFPVRFRLNN